MHKEGGTMAIAFSFSALLPKQYVGDRPSGES
jgi:hypothetical protein